MLTDLDAFTATHIAVQLQSQLNSFFSSID